MSQRECSWSTARELSKWEGTFFYLHDFYPDNVAVAFERLVEGLGLLEVSLVFEGLLVGLPITYIVVVGFLGETVDEQLSIVGRVF